MPAQLATSLLPVVTMTEFSLRHSDCLLSWQGVDVLLRYRLISEGDAESLPDARRGRDLFLAALFLRHGGESTDGLIVYRRQQLPFAAPPM